MEYLPIFLDVRGQTVLVDGGGTVAARRVERALSAGARVLSFDPDPGEELRALFGHRALTHLPRVPQEADFTGISVAYGAAEDPARDALLYRNAKANGALANVADTREYCDFITPSVVERDPITIAISTGGAAPVIARVIRARIEAMLPAAYGRLAAFVSGYRHRIAETFQSGRSRRRFWEAMIEGPAGDAYLAGRESDARARIEADLEKGEAGDIRRGEVWLVGAGPGDPDLLTFRALRLLQRADVVMYDRLVGSGILDLARRDAQRINVGKAAGNHVMSQAETTALMIRLAGEGKRVLRLKGGDPFIFGRGGEELEDVAHAGFPVQVVPGITAASGCGACAGIPLTHRDHAQSVVFVTAHGKGGVLEHDWHSFARPNQTVVIYMGLGQLGEIASSALAQGIRPDMPVAVIDNGSRANQVVITGLLDDIEARADTAGLKGPALIIMGDVVKMHGILRPGGGSRQHAMSLTAKEGF